MIIGIQLNKLRRHQNCVLQYYTKHGQIIDEKIIAVKIKIVRA